jgi:hypothetical protein
MHTIALEQKELTDLARTYGKVYDTEIGEVSYTKLTDPQGFVLLSKNDTLRFYLFRKKIFEPDPDHKGPKKEVKMIEKKGVWELVWGASSIVHDGLPVSEELIQWRLKHALRAGKQGYDEAEALGRAALDLAASAGTAVHKAAEMLLADKEVHLAGRDKRQVEHIASVANFINDFEIRNWRSEKIVAYDKTTEDGVRIVYAGTVDWIVEIKNAVTGKWETWLIDFKTSAEAYLSHKLQSIGYKEAAEQSLGITIDRIGILLLGRATKTGYKLVEVGRERKYRLTFKDFETTYRMLLLVNNGKLPEPSYKTYPKTIKLIKKEEDQNGVNNSNRTTDSGGDSSDDPQRKQAISKGKKKRTCKNRPS